MLIIFVTLMVFIVLASLVEQEFRQREREAARFRGRPYDPYHRGRGL